MLLWSQSSEPSSRYSDEHLSTWETLSNRFTLSLEQHEQTLKELGQKLETSEANLQRLTPLYELSLRQNEALKNYNSQIAERMQERDEDLTASYEENNLLKTALAKEKSRRLRDILLALAAGAFLAFAVPKIIKLLRMFKIIPL
jgi:Na+/phosphate symporter